MNQGLSGLKINKVAPVMLLLLRAASRGPDTQRLKESSPNYSSEEKLSSYRLCVRACARLF